MKKLISLTMVKNEASVIESFIRYNMNFIDKMIIIDNGCVDETIEIINCLIKEGYDIEIYNESYMGYDQYVIENKYLYKIANEMESDIIIPLDADEFIVGNDNRKEMFDNLDLNKVYYINWRTYVVTDNDDNNERFVPKRIKYIRSDECGYRDGEEKVSKIILPTELIRKYNIIMQAGHHSIIKKEGLMIEHQDNIKLAHFPIRSKYQMESKIFTGILNDILWHKREGGQSNHWFILSKKLLEDSNIIDIIKMSTEYGLEKDVIAKLDYQKDIIYHPIDLSNCKNIDIKYNDMADINVLKNIVKTAETIAIKCHNIQNKLDSGTVQPKKRILIYGTGSYAKRAFVNIDQNLFDILAYVDSDSNKEFMVINDKLIISPDKIKFFKYDKIIIASTFYKEIQNKLMEFHIKDEDIEDISYLTKVYIDSIS